MINNSEFNLNTNTNFNDYIIKPNKLNSQNTNSKVEFIDEYVINNVIDNMDNDLLNKLIFEKLPKPNTKKRKVKVANKKNTPPKSVLNIIKEYNITSELDLEKRVTLFIGVCKKRNYSYNTTLKYFNSLNGINYFGENCTIRPDPKQFIGKTHTRVIDLNLYKKFCVHLFSNFSRKTAPMILAVLTGLRTMEILQFTTYTIHQLLQQRIDISIKRKTTNYNVLITNSEDHVNYWRPVYNTHLLTFVNKLKEFFLDEYLLFKNKRINVKLFTCAPNTLNNTFKLEFFRSTNIVPPLGFGIHVCRYMTASLLREHKASLPALQQFMQHSSKKTTLRYMKIDMTNTTAELNKIIKLKLSNLIPSIEI